MQPISTTHPRSFLLLLFMALAQNLYAKQDHLLINEIQVANIDQFIDPSYNYGGWVELYNPTSKALDLNGFVIRQTDDEGKVEQYTLKSVHGKVPANGFAILWFDHHSNDGNYSENADGQIPFKLDADGGLIELLDSHGTWVDAVEYPSCMARCSWIRETDGAEQFGWTAQATPKASNNTCKIARERLSAPVVSTSGGVFTTDYRFTVDIPNGATLYYTTDSSTPVPGKSSKSTDGIFKGLSTTIYRFMLVREGFLNSPVVTRSLFRSDGNYSLPILSVNTAPENFFDNTIGLYVTGTNGRYGNNAKEKSNQNMDWERPVNVEYFVPDATGLYEEAVNQEALFSIFGGWTRFNAGNENFEYRSSFKLKSDKIFEGINSFAYPLFSSKPYIKIKNFLVRNGGQDQQGRMLDATIQELLRTSGVYLDCQAWQPAHVYLNGKYLGMMNLREESNKQFAFSNYGIDKDEIDQWEGDIVVKEGDQEKLNEWYNLSKQLTGVSSDSVIWKQIADLVDIDEYCNYMAAEIYMGNEDWLRGGFKNLKGFRAKEDGGKFHLVLHDVDGGFGDTDMILQVLNNGTGSLPVRFKNMLKYEPFKKQFIDAYCIMNGSVFDPERCVPLITAMKNTVNPALRMEGLSNGKLDRLISRLSDNEERRPALKQSLVKAFGLKGEYTVKLKSNIREAKLRLNGQEIPTGNFNGYLFPPITLTSSAPDGYLFEGWDIHGKIVSKDSILHLNEIYQPGSLEIEAVYQQVESLFPPIRINEVGSGNDIFINEYGKKADWLELYNNSDQDYDLSGAFLSDDPQEPHKYQIPSYKDLNTVVPARGYKVIWCDNKESKTQLHASFKLKNADDSFISITDAKDTWTDSLRYKEQPRWHTFGRYPDGGYHVTLFERPTIECTNHLCTSTILEKAEDSFMNTDTLPPYSPDRQIVAIRYYNLQGQQIADFVEEHIVIQHILYNDGSRQVRKVLGQTKR